MLQVMAGPDAKDRARWDSRAVPDLVRAGHARTLARRGGSDAPGHPDRGARPDFLAAQKELRTALLNQLDAIPGVVLADIAYPADWTLLTGTFNAARLAERTEPFRHWLREDPAKFGVSLHQLQGLMLSGDEWITAQRAENHLLREVLDGLMNRCDVLLQPGPSTSTSSGCRRSPSPSASTRAECRWGRSSAGSPTRRTGCWRSPPRIRRSPTGPRGDPPTRSRPPRASGSDRPPRLSAEEVGHELGLTAMTRRGRRGRGDGLDSGELSGAPGRPTRRPTAPVHGRAVRVRCRVRPHRRSAPGARRPACQPVAWSRKPRPRRVHRVGEFLRGAPGPRAAPPGHLHGVEDEAELQGVAGAEARHVGGPGELVDVRGCPRRTGIGEPVQRHPQQMVGDHTPTRSAVPAGWIAR